MTQPSTTEEDLNLRCAVVRGVYIDKCGSVRLEVFEPATSLTFEIRHGFDHDRGLNFVEYRRAMYGRGVLFRREELRSTAPGKNGGELVAAAYVFHGFERGDDL